MSTLSSTDTTDTIAAQATPPGRGGIGVIRISGPLVRTIATQLLKQCPVARRASYLPFYDQDGQWIDEGIALFFEAPHSFTGEDVLELQGHGGPVVMDCLLQQVVSYGARLANPGEFSERAFIHGKCDLAQAEAIADLINSSSLQAARSAVRSLKGEFSNKVNQIKKDLIYVRTYIEASLDFSEEDINLMKDKTLIEKIRALQATLKEVQEKAKQGALLQEGLHCVIAGKPNVGKSSLMNALTEQPTAIVSEIAGTTRDVIKDRIQIEGIPIHLIDTAGLRDNDDPIEQEGVKRALSEITQADVVVLVLDACSFYEDLETDYYQRILQQTKNVPIFLVKNKIDLTEEAPNIFFENDRCVIALSVMEKQGLDLFKKELVRKAGYEQVAEEGFIARRRHVDALKKTYHEVQQALQQLQQGLDEIAAECLRQAQQSLASITGEFHSDDLLGEIFSSFCIGK